MYKIHVFKGPIKGNTGRWWDDVRGMEHLGDYEFHDEDFPNGMICDEDTERLQDEAQAKHPNDTIIG